MPPMKAMGTNTITSTAVVVMTAKPTSRVPLPGRHQWGSPPAAGGGGCLHHHDGVVHHQADGEDERQQGDEADGKAQIPGADEAPRMRETGTVMAGIRVVRPA